MVDCGGRAIGLRYASLPGIFFPPCGRILFAAAAAPFLRPHPDERPNKFGQTDRSYIKNEKSSRSM